MVAGHVILTQVNPPESLMARLCDEGWQVHAWSALELTPASESTVPQPVAYDLVVFVSGNAVRFFRQQLESAGKLPWPVQIPAATVGPVSAQAVRRAFGSEVQVVHPPESATTFDSEALWTRLLPMLPALRSVLIVRGGEGAEGTGRNWLRDRFVAAGVQVSLHAAYRRSPAAWSAERLEQLRRWQRGSAPLVWVFASGDGVEAVARQIASLADGARLPWDGCRIVVTHPRVAQAVAVAATRNGLATRVVLDGDQRVQVSAAEVAAAVVIQVCLPQEDAVLAAIVH